MIRATPWAAVGRRSRAVVAGLVLAGILPAQSAVLGAADAPSFQPVPVSLVSYYNDRGIGGRPGAADFDGQGGAYPAAALPDPGFFHLDGMTYDFPGGIEDNVVALGQHIALPRGRYAAAYLLAASSLGDTAGTVRVRYAGGSAGESDIDVPDWSGAKEPGAIVAPYRYGTGAEDRRSVQIFALEVGLDPTRQALTLTLPQGNPPGPAAPSMHVFAISLQPVVPGYAVKLIDARPTSKLGAGGTQEIDATVVNVGSEWLTPAHRATVTMQLGSDVTVSGASITALVPGEQTPIEIGVRANAAVPQGTQVEGRMTVAVAGGAGDAEDMMVPLGAARYVPTVPSLVRHQAPDWYDGAKFGIFIHWGLYSVPAWAPVGGIYEEWYWHSMSQRGSPTYRHELQTYGPNARYDDFIARFTAARFDPRAWVRLFRQAGARYFVIVAKHHDGFALFRTHVSRRDSVDLGPHRDLVGALFAAARRYAPGLHPGVYYSLPEWYNPAFRWDDRFPGGPPRQYVTGASEPYTGYLPVKNYVEEVQVPQMRELIDQYHPDLLWCDIGGPNDSLKVIAHFYNEASSEGRDVAVNNRCGVPVHDFLTPEYRSYAATMPVKWEATRGIDPHSFGYNAATPAGRYATARQLIRQLVDVVSKNGNFLLDIGPRADGTIPPIMASRLEEIGAWLRVNGAAIYDTVPWWRTPQDGPLRFTVRPNRAFYITSLARPGAKVIVHAPVPIAPGDHVTLLGWRGTPLRWHEENGNLIIAVPPAAQRSGQFAWTFEVAWAAP